MFWENIKNELLKYGEIKEWFEKFMVIKEHGGICGIAIHSPVEISVVSHKYSYGGKEGLFEIMPSLDGNDVNGYLTEEEVINNINILCSRSVCGRNSKQ